MTALDLDAIKLRAIINGMREHLLGRNDSSAVSCPECAAGKHANCDGTTWDTATDALTSCPCFTATIERGEDHANRFERKQ
jgi:hypothetical protein